MSDLKQRALALYKPPFRHVHGYIYDADSRVVADDAAAKDEEAALRIRGWGRIQYLADPEALQDAAGDLIAEALTEYWQRRTQPEATAPAQDLSAAILRLQKANAALKAQTKLPAMAEAIELQAASKALLAAALASSANALRAGDRVDAEPTDAELLDFVAAHPEMTLRHHKRRWSFVGFTNYEYDSFKTPREAIAAAILQSQKDNHG